MSALGFMIFTQNAKVITITFVQFIPQLSSIRPVVKSSDAELACVGMFTSIANTGQCFGLKGLRGGYCGCTVCFIVADC